MAYPTHLKHSSSFLVKIAIVAVLSGGFYTQAMAAPAVAPSCSGDACSDIRAKFTGSCYHVKNTGSKKIKVKWGKHWLTLYGGQADTMKYPLALGGGCVKSITGSLSANYRDGLIK
jgi:hypothetical protein